MQTSNHHSMDERPQRGPGPETGDRPVPVAILTIGHSNHTMDRFSELLQQYGVKALADVRSSPFSQRYPQFNQPELQRALTACGIRYLFLGDELGGRPNDIAVYDGDGRVDYWRVRRTPKFQAGLDRLLGESKSNVICMMCAEEDPLDCHRALMVAAELAERGVGLSHVRGNGTCESIQRFESRLFEITGIGGGMATGLFAASLSAKERSELLTEAYKEQARRKAFKLAPGQDISKIDFAGDSFAE